MLQSGGRQEGRSLMGRRVKMRQVLKKRLDELLSAVEAQRRPIRDGVFANQRMDLTTTTATAANEP